MVEVTEAAAAATATALAVAAALDKFELVEFEFPPPPEPEVLLLPLLFRLFWGVIPKSPTMECMETIELELFVNALWYLDLVCT